MATTKKANEKFSKLAVTKPVMVTLPAKVTAKSIHLAIDEIFKLNGCTTCGLGGIDLRLRIGEVINPRFQENIVIAGY